MSIITTNWSKKSEDCAFMRSVARAVHHISSLKNMSCEFAFEVEDGKVLRAVETNDMVVMSVDKDVMISDSSRKEVIIDVIATLFSPRAYSTNAAHAIDAAKNILSRIPKSVTRIDIDTSGFAPRSDILIKRVSLHVDNKRVSLHINDNGRERILVQVSVFGIDFEIETENDVSALEKKLSTLL